jgi:hypothetical protein
MTVRAAAGVAESETEHWLGRFRRPSRPWPASGELAQIRLHQDGLQVSAFGLGIHIRVVASAQPIDSAG